MLNRTTINARIKRGMTREEAENTPLLIDKKLTLCYNAKNSKKDYNGIVN